MKAIDLFAGAGGLSLGLQRAGITIVAAVERDPDACESYRRNIGDHMIEADITQISPDQLPDCDLIAGGPPCQGFSYAGKRDPNDPRNQLWREYLRIVAAKRPSWILIENVRGIVSTGEYLPILAAFTDLGYRVNHYILNTADYGVPQSRIRVFFIGNRHGLRNPVPTPTHTGRKKRRGQIVREQLLLFPAQKTVRQALGIGVPLHADPYNPERTRSCDEPAATVNTGSRPNHIPSLAASVFDQPSATINCMDGGAVTTDRVRHSGYLPTVEITPEIVESMTTRLDQPASTVRTGRYARAGSKKHPGIFVATEVTDHGVIDLDAPSCVNKSGGIDANGHRGGAYVPSLPFDQILDSPATTIRANDGTGSRVDPLITRPHHLLPNIALDEPSPTILGCNSENSGHQGGAEPIRHRLTMAEMDRPAATIDSDSRLSSPGRHVAGSPQKVSLRRLTPRECATLQDFPEWFEFHGTKTSQHRQIGNAVPVGMARAIGLTILEAAS